MTDNMMKLFNELDNITGKRENYVRAPFAWAGGKSKSIDKILPFLPYRKSYIEPFGGSAAVLLARDESPLEVYNDRFGGVVAFYRCVRDEAKLKRLVDWLELSLHSREDFIDCRDQWKDMKDDVERAAKWYYMNMHSFGSLGRNFGRSTAGKSQSARKVERHIKDFDNLHRRMRHVQIENLDWRPMLRDYDNHDAVFYLDPPYLEVHAGTYKSDMSVDDHREMLDVIFSLDGFVALSSYDNDLYNTYSWTDIETWDVPVSIKAAAYTDENHKKGLEGSGRTRATEVLYIKE